MAVARAFNLNKICKFRLFFSLFDFQVVLLDLDVVYGSLLGGVGGHGHGHEHHHHPHGQNMSEHDHEHAHKHEHEHMNREHDHEHMNHEHMNHEHMNHEHRDREHMNNHEHMDHDEHTMMNEVEADELELVTERIKIIRKPPKPKRKGKNGKGKNGNRNRSGRRFGRNKLNSVVPPFNFRIPKTSFSCKGRAPGYYADMEAQCKVSIMAIWVVELSNEGYKIRKIFA